MPDHERVPRPVDVAGRSEPVEPGFGELLASCAAARAVSTPPSEDEARPVSYDAPRESGREKGPGEPVERRAA